MQDFNPGRAIFAGFVATLVMTVLIYFSPLLGMPNMDFAALLGSIFTEGTPQPWSTAWWTGMLILLRWDDYFFYHLCLPALPLACRSSMAEGITVGFDSLAPV